MKELADSIEYSESLGAGPLQILKYTREVWEGLIGAALGQPYTFIGKGSPKKFKAILPIDQQNFDVRYEIGDIGEEHPLTLLPIWEYQKPRIDEEFGREMCLDTDRLPASGFIVVKEADGAPPDPMCVRLLRYTLGESDEGFRFRVRKGESLEEIRAKLEFEGA
jgi:hypothetical protein